MGPGSEPSPVWDKGLCCCGCSRSPVSGSMCLALLVPFSGVGLVSREPQRGRPSWPLLAGVPESLAMSWGLCGSGFLTPGTSDPGFQDAWDSVPIRVCCPQAAGQEVAGVGHRRLVGTCPPSCCLWPLKGVTALWVSLLVLWESLGPLGESQLLPFSRFTPLSLRLPPTTSPSRCAWRSLHRPVGVSLALLHCRSLSPRTSRVHSSTQGKTALGRRAREAWARISTPVHTWASHLTARGLSLRL